MKTPKKVRQEPPWHPNFRNPESLPDIKVVRTDFLVNFAAVALASLFLIFFLYREIAVMGVSSDIADLERQRAEMAPGDARLVEEAREFGEQRPLYDDLERFFDAPLLVYRLFQDLALIRPEAMAFERVSYLERNVKVEDALVRRYEIEVVGQTRNLEVIEMFKDRIASLPYLDGYDLRLTEGSNQRNIELNTWGFSLTIGFTRSKPS